MKTKMIIKKKTTKGSITNSLKKEVYNYYIKTFIL